MLALLLCSAAASGQIATKTEDLNASDLHSLVVNATTQPESYRFRMDMNQTTNLVNTTSGETQMIKTESLGVGALNMTARALKIVMASLTIPEGDELNASASAMDEYLINDTIYFQIDGNWTKMALPDFSDYWSQQNTIGQQIEMLNNSNLTLVGSESIGGQDCYVLKAEMNSTLVEEKIANQSVTYLPQQVMNASDLFNNMTIDGLYWITKDSRQLKKITIQEDFSLNPQSIGLPGNDTNDLVMDISTTITLVLDGIGESVSVVLPSEADSARPFLDLMVSMDTASMPANSTLLNASMNNTSATQSVAENATQTA